MCPACEQQERLRYFAPFHEKLYRSLLRIQHKAKMKHQEITKAKQCDFSAHSYSVCQSSKAVSRQETSSCFEYERELNSALSLSSIN